MTVPAPDLRDRLVTALSEAGAFCGECGFQPGDVGCPDCQRAHESYADAMLGVFQPELDRLSSERDAADEALHGQPVLRHCVVPGCLREYDATGGLSGKPVRESWSSTGWLMIPSLHSHICPEHTALVADDAHRPDWDRAAIPTVLVCACGWRSPGVRWSGFATAAWRDHLLTVTEGTT